MVHEARQQRLVHFARKHLGKPYRYGAKPREAPRVFDCSSFVQYLYRRIEMELPRTSIDQARCGKRIKVTDSNQLNIGDLLFFRGSVGRYDEDFPEGIGHVVMYLGSGQIVHAKYDAKTGGCVRTDSARRWLARSDLTVIKRVLL